MLKSIEKLQTLNSHRRLIAISFGVTLTAVIASSFSAAQAAYDYTQDTSMPEAGIRIALMDATIHDAVAPKLGVAPKLSDDLDVFKTTLKGCRTRVSSLIAAGESTGTLTVAQTDTMRFQLDSLNGIEKELNAKIAPSYKYLLQLADHYDSIQASINDLMGVYELQMVPTDPAAVLVGGTTINLDAAMKRRAMIEDEISSELSKGQISGKQALRLRNMLNTLAVKELKLRKSGGSLQANELTQVDRGLTTVSTALNSTLSM
ncbi:MAG: hypothetical protein SGJ27_12085 [Candidatus Melainabacteria bacterium]|nr:hypothetical protein [Candidatus Melainabacteria bacterium]